MLELGLKLLLAYLMGSVMGAMLLGAVRGVDIRQLGSGNAGGTNALRTQGLPFAFGVVIVDVGKGALAAGPLAAWAIPLVETDPQVSREWLAASCALAVAVGQVWPVWHEFRGGKAGATLIGALAVLSPLALLAGVAAWLLAVTLTGFVSLGTMLGTATVPASAWLWSAAPLPLACYGLAMSALIVWAHRDNIGRMRAGNERRAQSLWLLGPRGAAR